MSLLENDIPVLPITTCATRYACESPNSDLDGRKSTTIYILTLGDIAISWNSKLQGKVSLSTIETESVAILEVAKEMI